MQVINGKTDGFLGQDKIYIGRTNTHLGLKRSALANPYLIGFDGDREEVIELYRRWLWHKIKDSEIKGKLNVEALEIYSIAKKVQNNQQVILTCYCKPLACHGDVIVRCVNWFIQEYLSQ